MRILHYRHISAAKNRQNSTHFQPFFSIIIHHIYIIVKKIAAYKKHSSLGANKLFALSNKGIKL